MKNLPSVTSTESTDLPSRFSDQSASSDQSHQYGALTRLSRRLPCHRCWSALVASAAISAVVVGGVLLVVALLVRHHDQEIEKLEKTTDMFSTSSAPSVINWTRPGLWPMEQMGPNRGELITNTSCISRPCLNGGTCFSVSNYAQCVCQPDYTGPFCTELRSENSSMLATTSTPMTTTSKVCSGRECLNGGYCSDTKRCQCPQEYTGRFCQSPSKGLCASSPCLYDTVCTETGAGSGYHCDCPDGLFGTQCEQVTCGSNSTLTATASSELISTPDFPNDALPVLNCTWAVTAQFYFVKLSMERVYLHGESCYDSFLDVYDLPSMALIKRLCPHNASVITFQTRGSQSITIRYMAQSGSYFRITYSSPELDACTYFNNASCVHGKCWPEETKAVCVCDPCYRGIGCSEEDKGNCTSGYCSNGGTCSYNCYLQTKRCHCTKGYDPKTNCAQKCPSKGAC